MSSTVVVALLIRTAESKDLWILVSIIVGGGTIDAKAVNL